MIQVEKIDNPIVDCMIMGDYKPKVDEVLSLYMFRIKTKKSEEVNVYANKFVSMATAGNNVLLSIKDINVTYNIQGIVYDKDRNIEVLWKQHIPNT